ncbi:MAG: leucine-rich repeat domain-containing protein [Clostridia bacterium]|nr:leucine-rich repeat domain-containing protein [Clostridia bacterium]
MKRLLYICLAIIMCLTSAIAFAGCKEKGGPKDKDDKYGLFYKKVKGEDYYVIYDYKGDQDLSVLDIGEIAKEKDIVFGKIASKAFSGDSTLKKIIVPNTVFEIGAGAFEKMTKLEEITLPFFGKNAHGEAFYNQIPSSKDKAVKEEATFGYVFGTESYDFGAEINNSYNGSTETLYYIPTTLSKVTLNPREEYVVPMYAFYGVTQISIVDLKNVKEIGEFAFAECASLDTIYLYEQLNTIRKNAFECCEGLTNESFILDENISVKTFEENFVENAGISEEDALNLLRKK